MADFVKSLDAGHLISTGHANLSGPIADFAIQSVSFATWHGYADYEKMSVEQFNDQIYQFCKLGAGANKPILLEEFALANTSPELLEAYKTWMETIRDDSNCAGWIVWRLVSRKDDGEFPADTDHFDIHNDGGPLWKLVSSMAEDIRK